MSLLKILPKLEFQQRINPSKFWTFASPILALLITVLIGAGLFAIMNINPVKGLEVFFYTPISTKYFLGEIALKAAPLLLIALGLSVCFRANVWNIGAEGQFVIGAVCASGIALMADANSSRLMLIAVLLAGAIGGALWAGIVALLKDKFHANEILTSLMLVYISIQVLGYFVYGSWKDPAGYNFPQTRLFDAAVLVPKLFTTSRAHIGLIIALIFAALLWIFWTKTKTGFALQIGGTAPMAAKYAGFSSRKALWTVLLLSGSLAGLAGAIEVAGPIGQLTPYVPAGYGFAAIIVAFVGRLNPLGMCFSAVLLSMFYIGGELAQSRLGLPKSMSLVFQGLLLFSLLAADTLVKYKIVQKRKQNK